MLMIRAELRRLYKNRSLLLLIITFFVLSIFQCIYVSTTEDVRSLSKDISVLKTTDFSKSVDAYSYAKTLGLSESAAFRADRKEKYSTTYTQLLQNTNDKLDSVLFSSEQNQLELKKQKETLEFLLSEPFIYMNDILFTQYTSFNMYWSFIYLFIGLYCVYLLIQQDTDSSLFPLFNSCSTSYKSLLLSKIISILLLISTLYVVKTGIDLLYFQMSGLSLNAPFQMLNTIDIIAYTLPLGTYYILLTASSYIGVLVLLLFFIFFYSFTKSSALSFFVSTAFMIIELLLNRFLSVASSLSLLKQFNIYTILTMDQLFEQMVYVFHTVIPRSFLIPILCFLLILVFIICSLFFFRHSVYRKVSNDKRFFLHSSHFIIYQLKEVLLQRKALLIILIVFGYCFYDMNHYKVVKNNQESSYDAFVQQYYGPINDELLERIETDKQQIYAASDRSDQLVNKMIENDGILSEEEGQELYELESLRNHKDDIDQISMEVQSLKEMNVQYYVDNKSLILLVEKKNPMGTMIHSLLILIPLICIIFSTMSKFYQENTYRYVFCTKIGETKYYLRQWMHYFMIAILLFGIVFGLFYFKITKYYTYHFMNQTVNQALGIHSTLHMSTWLLLYVMNYVWIFVFTITSAMALSKKLGTIAGTITLTGFIILLCILPNGLFLLLRYDFLDHLLKYIIVLTMVVILTITLSIQQFIK